VTARQVTIKRIQRNKNKYVTAIHGLEAFGALFILLRSLPASIRIYAWVEVDLKKAAKLFAQKFATGASVTKNAQGFDEIVVQVCFALLEGRTRLSHACVCVGRCQLRRRGDALRAEGQGRPHFEGYPGGQHRAHRGEEEEERTGGLKVCTSI
jgi:translation initiation factor 1 (eIF-1/SUI1)